MKFNFKEENGSIVITGVENLNDGNVEIPKQVDGKPVTKIGESSFQYCDKIRSINIPDSVTEIGKWAFSGCSKLVDMNIPNSVTSVGRNAFSYCSSLASVNLSDNVTEIASSTFSGCTSLTSIRISKVVTKIDWYAFVDCTSLVRISIPHSVMKIGGAAFKGCSSLSNLNIPDSVIEIGWHAFEGCSKLETINVGSENINYSSVEGVLYNKSETTLICFPIHKDGSFDIPDSITNIREDSFWGCSNLTSINIPESVIKIGNHAFNGCSLTSIQISDRVEIIGEWAFGDCKSLSSIIVTGEGDGNLETLQELKKGIAENDINYFSGSVNAFNYLLNPKQKYKLAFSYCKGETQYYQADKEVYDSYIASHIMEITTELIGEDSVVGLIYIANANKINSDNIDRFIDVANKAKAISTLAFLMEYKNNHISLKDIENQLSLD